MRKAQFAYFAALAALVACGELRNADVAQPDVDAGTSDPIDAAPPLSDGDDDDDPARSDGGGDGGDGDGDAGESRPYQCAGACPIERLSLSNMTQLRALAVDDTTVYFVEGLGGVRACPKAGCTDVSVVKLKTFQAPPDLVAWNGIAYWADESSLVSCPKAGCGTLTTILTEAGNIDLLTADDSGRIAWQVNTPSAALRTCTLGSCTSASTIIGTSASALAVRGNAVAWVDVSDVSSCTFGVAPGQCQIGKVDLGSGAPYVAISEDRAFWLVSGEIHSCPRSGCATATKVATSKGPARPTLDAANLYWVDLSDQAVYRCPQTGCDRPELVAMVDDATFSHIAFDKDYVYWTSNAGLFRRRK